MSHLKDKIKSNDLRKGSRVFGDWGGVPYTGKISRFAPPHSEDYWVEVNLDEPFLIAGRLIKKLTVRDNGESSIEKKARYAKKRSATRGSTID